MNTPFTVCSLFSGSKGNCIYIRALDTEILIDAGVCAKSIEEALHRIGSDLSRIDAILITHEHSDHIKGLPVLCKHHKMPIHMTAASASQIPLSDALKDCAHLHEPHYEARIGQIHVTAVPAPHDSVCCVGFRLECEGHTVAVATDLGRVTKEIVDVFLGVEGVILESNHDVDLLLQNPHYPPYLKQRILSGQGHLSNDFSARFLSYLAKNGTKYAMLAHLSKENNTPELALSALKEKLTCPLQVAIAKENEICYLIPPVKEEKDSLCFTSPSSVSAR